MVRVQLRAIPRLATLTRNYFGSHGLQPQGEFGYTTWSMPEFGDRLPGGQHRHLRPGGGAAPGQGDLLHRQVARVLRDRRDIIAADVVGAFPLQGPQRLDTDYCLRLGHVVLQALGEAVERDGLDYRSPHVSELAAVAAERSLTPDLLFAFVALAERTSLDELALEPPGGTSTESWATVTQIVQDAGRRVLAAWTTRHLHMPSPAALVDPLTTLSTRAVFDAVLAKECHRAERAGRPFALFLLDVDALGDLNRAHGYGVGDRVLERLGVLLHAFFRKHDWVARYDEDALAVLLPETSSADAEALANQLRRTVQERLTFRDYRTDRRVVVTVSVAVVTVPGEPGVAVDPQAVCRAAEQASARAKAAGRSTLEHVGLRAEPTDGDPS